MTTEQIEVQMRDDLPKFIRAISETDGDRKVFDFANCMCNASSETLQIFGSHLHDHIRNAVNELDRLQKYSPGFAQAEVTWADLAENLD
jgi:hypothetical protein